MNDTSANREGKKLANESHSRTAKKTSNFVLFTQSFMSPLLTLKIPTLR